MDLRSATDIVSEEIKMWYSITGLNLPPDVDAAIKTYKNKATINAAKLASEFVTFPGFIPSEKLIGKQNALDRKIRKTQAQIKAELHSRLVFGTGCIAMILIGISLGIIKKGGHLLSAFGASCLPAAALIVCIMSGKQLTENLGAQTVSGVSIMWAGLAVLFLFMVALYYHLMRN